MKEITKRQQEIFDFIYHYVACENRPPTIIEIKSHFNIVSNQAVVDHLIALEKKEYIKRLKNSRGILLLKTKRSFPILGRVSAGNPFESGEYHDEHLKLESLFDEKDSYVIRVKGDSMKNAGILEGDYIIVKYQNKVDSGEIGIAVIDGETTVKRIIYRDNKVILQPENDLYTPIEIDPNKTPLLICGKVIGVVRKLPT